MLPYLFEMHELPEDFVQAVSEVYGRLDFIVRVGVALRIEHPNLSAEDKLKFLRWKEWPLKEAREYYVDV
jgi:hypothetical protein